MTTPIPNANVKVLETLVEAIASPAPMIRSNAAIRVLRRSTGKIQSYHTLSANVCTLYIGQLLIHL